MPDKSSKTPKKPVRATKAVGAQFNEFYSDRMDDCLQCLKKMTGLNISKSDVLFKIVKAGLPIVEKELRLVPRAATEEELQNN